VVGTRSANVLTVKIAKDAKISELKDIIKEKKRLAFQRVDADELYLWQVRRA
jgi:hypothetical protein